MALVDPYSPCPCGSGKKFKWCCHKAESYAERALRMVENGQVDSALAVLDEGLSKVPGNAWLLLRKALLLMQMERPEEAKRCVAAVLERQPDHRGASMLMIRIAMAADGAAAAAAQLQHALLKATPEMRDSLGLMAQVVALGMAREHRVMAAFKHMELSEALEPAGGRDEDAPDARESARHALRGTPISPWLKDGYELAGPPEGVGESQRGQFEQALAWAREGLWESAAAAFDLLSGGAVAGPAAERNAGLCRLWLGDDRAGVAALRRWIGRTAPSTDAVDLAVVCLSLDETEDQEPIEHVQLSWPIRDRAALLRTFEDDSAIVRGPKQPADPDDEDSPEVDVFYWLDRPKVEARPGLAREEIPLVRAELLVGDDSVALEADDDGGLNGLMEAFTALAGQAIPPAHPRTKTVGKVGRERHALSWHWYLPEGLEESEGRRLTREQTLHVIRTKWVETPIAALGGRTPRQAAQANDAPVLLRAALLQLETSEPDLVRDADWTGLRADLGVPPEPVIDPETVEIDRVPLGRMAFVPIARLDYERLKRYYRRAGEWGLSVLRVEAARELVRRPATFDEDEFRETVLFGELALDAAFRREREEAMEWLRQGRAAESPARRAASAPDWDMLELRVRTQFDEPEAWAPELSRILDRYDGDEQAMMALTAHLMSLRLIRVAEHPDRPGQILMDSRPLQQLLALYGPKVKSASEYLGVSATKGGVWTPESAAPGPSIWTPGATAPAAGGADRPRIILPGQ